MENPIKMGWFGRFSPYFWKQPFPSSVTKPPFVFRFSDSTLGTPNECQPPIPSVPLPANHGSIVGFPRGKSGLFTVGLPGTKILLATINTGHLISWLFLNFFSRWLKNIHFSGIQTCIHLYFVTGGIAAIQPLELQLDWLNLQLQDLVASNGFLRSFTILAMKWDCQVT